MIVSLNDVPDQRTDKFNLGYVDAFYDSLFIPIRGSVTNVLEIGIQYGYSLIAWRDFFPNATVFGVDPDAGSCQLSNEPRIVPLFKDAYDSSFVDWLQDDYFDIVIDDGPHTFESMCFFLDNYLNKVKPGGYLVLEDIIDRSWTPKLVERIPETAGTITVHEMAGRQRTPELLARWQNGLDVIVVQKRAQ